MSSRSILSISSFLLIFQGLDAFAEIASLTHSKGEFEGQGEEDIVPDAMELKQKFSKKKSFHSVSKSLISLFHCFLGFREFRWK